MGKAKKKTAISKKEEQQAQKVKKVCPDGENHVICGEFLFCNAFVTPVISM